MCNVREINSKEVTAAVKELFLDCNYRIGNDILNALNDASKSAATELESDVLSSLIENNKIAAEESVPVCQDTGMAIIFAEYGDKVYLSGESFEEAVNRGVASAYTDGYLRKSVVRDPVFDRTNTGDNTPAIIHTSIVPGNKIRLTAVAKGFGSENMSTVKMLKPSDGIDGIIDAVVNAVKSAGSKACPPMIVGVGIGGTFEQAALLAKKACVRPLDSHNSNSNYAMLESRLLEEVNRLDIGAAGFGGNATALGLNIEYCPTHIAGLPVGINICCHASRHSSCEI